MPSRHSVTDDTNHRHGAALCPSQQNRVAAVVDVFPIPFAVATESRAYGPGDVESVGAAAVPPPSALVARTVDSVPAAAPPPVVVPSVVVACTGEFHRDS